MSLVEKTALVKVPASMLYEIVTGVDDYPDFLPWCKSTRSLSRTEDEQCAEIEVSKAGVTQSFSTCNRLFPYHRVEIRLRQGPFNKLEGTWEFTELSSDACKVSLMLEFDFSNPLMRGAFGVVFGQIANSLVDAFCKRANELANKNDG
jgi:ribosome-associated toxin RatA of RatAB toxin-antitoxin module